MFWMDDMKTERAWLRFLFFYLTGLMVIKGLLLLWLVSMGYPREIAQNWAVLGIIFWLLFCVLPFFIKHPEGTEHENLSNEGAS